MVIDPHEVVQYCLGHGVRAVEYIRRGLGELRIGQAGRTKDLVRRNMQGAEYSLDFIVEPTPVDVRRLQQGGGVDDVGLDKLLRTADGAVYVAFCSKVNRRARSASYEQPVERSIIADVRSQKYMTQILFDYCQYLVVARVGQLIGVNDTVNARVR